MNNLDNLSEEEIKELASKWIEENEKIILIIPRGGKTPPSVIIQGLSLQELCSALFFSAFFLAQSMQDFQEISRVFEIMRESFMQGTGEKSKAAH